MADYMPRPNRTPLGSRPGSSRTASTRARSRGGSSSRSSARCFEDNLYHGDLHPGNMLLLRNNRVALIDFGAATFTEREYLQKFPDVRGRAGHARLRQGRRPVPHADGEHAGLDQDTVKDELVRALRAWATRTQVPSCRIIDKSIDNAAIQVVTILVRHKCTMEWAWLRIHRALTDARHVADPSLPGDELHEDAAALFPPRESADASMQSGHQRRSSA